MNTQTPNPRILVVEDDPSLREGIHRILTLRKLEASMASDGEEALRMIEGSEYPLVLVDLKMPGIDGFELIERVNRLKPETVCVVVSAFATVESIVRATKMGTFDFVAKPFVPDELMIVVNRAIEKCRLTAETARLRKEHEAHLLQLAAEKSRLNTIVQSMADGLLVVNISNDVVLDNTAARMILRRIDKPFQCVPVSAVIPDDAVCRQIAELLLNPAPHQVKLEMIVGPRSEQEAPAYIRVTLAPFRDENDKVLGVAVLLSDISDTKAYEQMKTKFVSMVAHEIKAPIAAIESYLNVIVDGILDGNVPRIKEIAGRCLERSSAMLALVQDLLEITRQEAYQRKRLIEKIDILSLAAKLVEFHRVQAAERKISIGLSSPPKGLKPLYADVGEMERVLTNLLSNAIKYNREGGQIWIRLDSTPSALRVEVEDTGIGLKPEEIKRIGEEFFRAKNEKTWNITGTGLGLYLVKRIVKTYHGSLKIESQVNKGSIFRILLPFGSADDIPV
jgi:two-component system, OmpR family, phosphate regulon sensor histidine kinase PhoR